MAPHLTFWTGKIPDSAAVKLTRMRFEVTFEFHLEYGGVTFRPALGLPATEKCDKFSATLTKFERRGHAGHFQLELPRPERDTDVLEQLKVRFTDKEGKIHEQPLGRNGWIWQQRSIVVPGTADLALLGEVSQVAVVAPSKTHVEKLECDFRDIPVR